MQTQQGSRLSSALDEAAVQTFRESLRGGLIRPGDADYDQARQIWNGMIDKRPAVIVRCLGTTDVINGVRFAREHNLLVAVRGGGHNVAGNALCDDGLVIDLSLMKGIRVDPVRRTVRAEPGVKWGELDREVQTFGLATTGGTVTDTGIAGLTLGGGMGWLAGKYGAACDNLLSADVVLADGRFVTASATENEDLFWALRGAGHNFGIVTSFKYQLHPVGPIVLGGLVLYPFSQAREVLQFYREFVRTMPDELVAYAALLTSPEGMPAAAVAVCYAGPVEDGEPVVQPLRTIGQPIADHIGPLPYTIQQTLLDAAFPVGRHYYIKSQSLADFSDKAIDTVIDSFSRVPSPFSAAIITHNHGAYQRVSPDETSFSHRATHDLMVFAGWEDPGETEKQIQWTRELYQATQPFSDGGVYVNELSDDDRDRVREAYGKTYDRLVELKKKYDPTNFFRRNQNISPTG